MNINLIGDHKTKIRLRDAKRLWLFLDYDGTLAEFARTPDDIIVDHTLISILDEIRKNPNIRIAIVSGRRLAHIRKLIPLQGILLAGSYGVETIDFEGKKNDRLDYNEYRQYINILKPEFDSLLEKKEAFYLEDKGWSLAIHGKYAEDTISKQVIAEAERLSKQTIDLSQFQILGGHRFFEIAPKEANKGKTIKYLLHKFPFEDALPVYIGDDDKDEIAFKAIKKSGGIPILVSNIPRETEADLRFSSPLDLRNWLNTLHTM